MMLVPVLAMEARNETRGKSTTMVGRVRAVKRGRLGQCPVDAIRRRDFLRATLPLFRCELADAHCFATCVARVLVQYCVLWVKNLCCELAVNVIDT